MADGKRTIHIQVKVQYMRHDVAPHQSFSDVFRVLVERGVMRMWHESGDYTEIVMHEYERIWWD